MENFVKKKIKENNCNDLLGHQKVLFTLNKRRWQLAVYKGFKGGEKLVFVNGISEQPLIVDRLLYFFWISQWMYYIVGCQWHGMILMASMFMIKDNISQF